MDVDEDEEEEEDTMPESIYGIERAGEGMWSSCIKVVDVLEREVLQAIQLGENEGLCVCVCVERCM
jgi:hypothetical protein